MDSWEAEELLTLWLAWMEAAAKPATTTYLRARHMRVVLREVPVSPTVVTTEDLVAFLGGPRSRAWKPNTKRSYRATLRAFFVWLQASGRRADNPAATLPPVRVPRGVARPTPEAVYRAAVLAADSRVRLMIQLAAVCGLRRGEIARLKREHVRSDLVGWCVLVHGKGGHQRLVPLPDALALDIREMPDGWLFPSTGRPGGLTPAHVGKLVSQALPDHWTCHTLRHRCATVAYAAERDILAVQELLGHAKTETTKLYTQVPRESVRLAVTAAAA